MKPGFIVTDNPNKFNKIIENYKSKGWILNAGNVGKVTNEKYIFLNYTENTDFYNVAENIRVNKLDFYTADGCLVEVRTNVEKEEKESFVELPIPENQKVLEDTALVMVSFHYSPGLRNDALKKGIEQLKRLNPMPKIIFYEAGYSPEFEDIFKNDIYKFIPVTEENKNLWQKESLFNLIVEENPQFKNYIFHDGDTFPDNPDWALTIKKMLDDKEICIIQNGYYYEDTVFKNRSKFLYVFSKSMSTSGTVANPGLSISMSKRTFYLVGGFTPYFIGGSGDAGFVAQTDISCQYMNPLKENCEWWKREADVRKKKVDYFFVPYKLTHFSHGSYKERGYHYRNKAIEWLGIKNIRDYVRVGENGLLEYIKYKNEISYVLANKSRMVDAESTLEVVREAMNQDTI